MENTQREAPPTWHDINARARQIAGNSALVHRVAEVYKRYPGLNVHFINRLDYFDHKSFDPQDGFFYFSDTTILYNMDRAQVEQAVDAALQRQMLGNPLDGSFRDSTKAELVNLRLDEGHAMQIGMPVNNPAEKGLSYQYPITDRESQNIVMGTNDILTRQEIIASMSSLPREQVRADLDFTLAEIHTFIRDHEYMHARAGQVWFHDQAFMDPNVETEADRVLLTHKALKLKLSQAHGSGDLYWKYLNEQMADTAAALHHMQRGGSISLVQNISDARAASFSAGVGEIYYSTSVLDKIIENEETVRQRLSELEPEEIDELSAYLVGSYSWDRDEFYANAAASKFVTVEKMKFLDCDPDEIAIAEGEASAKALKLYEQYSPDFREQTALMANQDERVKALSCRGTEGAIELSLRGVPLRQVDHVAEVQAAIQYNQELNPQFNSTKGALHLAGIRARAGNRGFPCDRAFDKPVLDSVESYYRATAAIEAQEQAADKTRQEAEPEQAQMAR